MTATSTLDRPHWERAPLADLIRFIVTRYHDSLRAELPELVTLAERVESRHGGSHGCPQGLAAHLKVVHTAVIDHLAKEEKVLFPLILEGYGARTAGPVRVMEMEHEQHGINLARIRELTSNLTPPDDACATWQGLYERLGRLESELLEHIALEDTVLFPRALSEG